MYRLKLSIEHEKKSDVTNGLFPLRRPAPLILSQSSKSETLISTLKTIQHKETFLLLALKIRDCLQISFLILWEFKRII